MIQFTQFKKRNVLLYFFLMLSSLVIGQPTAQFTHNLGSQNGCVPTTVGFTNASSSDVTSFDWSVDNVSFSSQENPIRTFTVGGTYNVCLEVTNNANQTDRTCQELTFYDRPIISLTATPQISCDPTDVTFEVISNVPMQTVTFDFGDGQVSSDPVTTGTTFSLVHTYSNFGNYSITMTVFDENGCEATIVESNLIYFPDPINPDFSATPRSACQLPLTTQFTNLTNHRNNFEYSWDFGDGNTSTDQDPQHTYSAFGTYTVTLTVTDSQTNCSEVMTKTDYINLGDFVTFEYELVDNGDCGITEVQFTNLTPGTINSILWDFGDGNTSTQVNPRHIYAVPGCYTPTLTITTADGCDGTRNADDCIEAIGPVTLDYTTSGDLTGCDTQNGLTVAFQGMSNQAVSWHWDFGGLDTSNLQNPTFTFNQVGQFPVTLTVTFSNGCQQSITRETVELQSIGIQIEADTLSGCAPLPVQFTSTVSSIDPISSYLWNFGFTTSTDPNPLITFPDSGTYDVQLIVATNSGCRDTLTLTEYIEVGIPPMLSFLADPLTTCSDSVINFTNLSSDYTDEWLWSFGDGTTSDTDNPLHQYADTGLFSVTLVGWFNGCPDTLVMEDLITIHPPLAGFTFDQDCADPNSIVFTDASIGAHTWNWDFGDGVMSTDTNPSHTYATYGTYTVELRVFNNDTGCEDVTRQEITVSDPTPDFTLSGYEICAGDTLQVINGVGGDATFEFEVPPNITLIADAANDREPQLAFPVPGQYHGIILRTTSANGCTGEYTLPDTVTVNGAETSFTASITNGCPPLDVAFTQTTNVFGGTVTDYLWDFGNGQTSVLANPVTTYSDEGFYDVTLTVTTSDNCTTTYSLQNYIWIEFPVSTFTSGITDCATNEVTFSNTSTGGTLLYNWNFGDGNTSTVENPTHAYTNPGKYEVCLEVTNSPGCTDQMCDSVDVSAVMAAFSGDNLYKSCASPPLITNFTDESQNAISWTWDFGDGTGLSTLQNPGHAYSRAGTYTVCLRVTDVFGCEDTHCETDYIQVDGPDGDFTASSPIGCAPFDIQFDATAVNHSTYIWDFGDGTGLVNATSAQTDAVTHTYTTGGKFVPVLVLEDVSGCRISIVGDTVEIESLIPDFTATDTTQCEGTFTAINFTNTSTGFGPVTSYDWEFAGADNPSSTDENPTGVIYSTPGTYDVVLTLTTAECTETIRKDNFITIHPDPVVAFTADQTGCEPFRVQFQNASIIDSGMIERWSWDFGTGDTSSVMNPVYTFAEEGNYTVQLTAYSAEGCQQSSTLDIVVLPTPEVIASGSQEICLGDIANLSSEVNDPGVTYAWMPTDGLSCTDCPDPVANPTVTTIYTLTVTNSVNCSNSDTVEVVVRPFPLPDVQVTRDTGVCLGDLIQLTVASNTSPVIFNWETSITGLSCYDCTDPIVSITEPTTFIVYVTGAGNCINQDSVFVDVYNDQPNLLGEDRTICENGSVQLNLLNGNDPQWSPILGLSCIDCENPVASPQVTTTYRVSALNDRGCEVIDTITVFVQRPEDVTAGVDTSICAGSSYLLAGEYQGTGAWFTANNQPINTNSVSPTSNTFYILEVTNDQCVLRDTVNINIVESPEISVSDTEVCAGRSVNVSVTGNATDYLWVPATGLSDPTIANPIASPTETTTYMVLGSFGTCAPDTAFVTVEVFTAPEVEIVARPVFAQGESVQLNAVVTENRSYNYEWIPADHLSCDNCARPLASPPGDMSYTVVVSEGNGCVDSATIDLIMLEGCSESTIVMPNAFTPNGDGENDILFVRGDANVQLFRVFDRWGELVFETNSISNGWDGRFRGQVLNRDVFVYYIEGICDFDGSKIIKTGDVLLVR